MCGIAHIGFRLSGGFVAKWVYTHRNELKAMPLTTGTWSININGTLAQINIESVDSAGNLTGTLKFSTETTGVSGFWDELSQKVTFFLADQSQAYTGFLFQDRFRMPGLTGSVVFTLAGTYQDFANGSTDRLAFGWYAQIGAA